MSQKNWQLVIVLVWSEENLYAYFQFFYYKQNLNYQSSFIVSRFTPELLMNRLFFVVDRIKFIEPLNVTKKKIILQFKTERFFI